MDRQMVDGEGGVAGWGVADWEVWVGRASR